MNRKIAISMHQSDGRVVKVSLCAGKALAHGVVFCMTIPTKIRRFNAWDRADARIQSQKSICVIFTWIRLLQDKQKKCSVQRNESYRMLVRFLMFIITLATIAFNMSCF
jgi:hypothetical protein